MLKSSRSRRFSRSAWFSCSRLALLAPAISVAAASIAHGAARSYDGPDGGTWNVAANWTGNTFPVAGDDVTLGDIRPTGATNLDVAMNWNGPFNPWNSVTLNSSALPGTMILSQTIAASSMYTITETMGSYTPQNTYNQSDGTNNTTTLNLGVSSTSTSNTFNLFNNGFLSVTNAENIGLSGGGTFSQSGGTHSQGSGNNQGVTLGVNSGANGSYYLSAGTFSSYALQVAQNGTGFFSQTGGTASTFDLQVGGFSGTGTYNLTGGKMQLNSSALDSAIVGSNGTMNVGTAGTLAVPGGIQVTGTGVFNLNAGGTLSAIHPIQVNGGTFNLNGGSVTATEGLQVNSGLFNFKGGSFAAPPVVSDYGTIRLNGLNISLAKLTGTGIVESFTDGGTLTLVGTAAPGVPESSLFQGTLRDGGGFMNVLKGGTNPLYTQVMGGTSTYTGGTGINAGTLAAGSNTGFSPFSAIILNGGTLDAAGYQVTVGAINAIAGTTINLGSGSITTNLIANSTCTATLVGSGDLKLVGAGALTVNGGGSMTGQITVAGGSLRSTVFNGLPAKAVVNLLTNGTLEASTTQTIGALAGAGTSTHVNFSGSIPTLTVGNNDGSSTYAGDFTGTGIVRKIGLGTFTLGLGAADSTLPNNNVNATFDAEGGVLLLDKADGTNAIGGPLYVAGGIVRLNRGNQIANTSAVSINSGTLDVGAFNEVVGNLVGTGGAISLNGGTLHVNESSQNTFAGAIVGTGTFIQEGPSTLTLTGAGAFAGTIEADAGKINLQGSAVASLLANNTATIHLGVGTLGLGAGEARAQTGGTIEYVGSTVFNGFLRGAGTHVILPGSASTFSAVTTFKSTTLTQNGPATFKNFTNNGTIQNNVPLTLDGLANTSSGTINVNATINAQDLTSDGVINIASGATLAHTLSSLTLGGGSHTTVAAGGTLGTAAGTSIDVNGGLLVNNGTVTGTTNVNYGGLAKGVGVYGVVHVNDGGIFSPGVAGAFATAVNDASLANGSKLVIELAGATQGSQYDAIISSNGAIVSGTLALTMLNGYLPAYGVSHHIITSVTPSTGIFQNVTGNKLSPDHWLAVTYSPNGVNVAAALPGDADLNGTVNFNDLLIIAKNYNQTTGRTWTLGDFDGTGGTDFNDLLALAKFYNQSLPASATLPEAFAADFTLAQSLVPEPGVLGLIVGLAGVTRRRRR